MALLRRKAGMSQPMLALKTGVAVRTIAGLESAREARGTPRYSTIERLANGIGCKMADLAPDDPDKAIMPLSISLGIEMPEPLYLRFAELARFEGEDLRKLIIDFVEAWVRDHTTSASRRKPVTLVTKPRVAK